MRACDAGTFTWNPSSSPAKGVGGAAVWFESTFLDGGMISLFQRSIWQLYTEKYRSRWLLRFAPVVGCVIQNNHVHAGIY